MAIAYDLQYACEPFALPEDLTCDCGDLDEDEVQALLDQAADILVQLSGGRYRGQCTETVRPRGPGNCDCFCSCAAVCRCSPLRGFTLPSPLAINSDGRPDIVVTIDGELFDDWVLVDGNFLMRGDGLGWPGCQDLTIPDDEEGSFVVSYRFGDTVDLVAQNAAVEIACFFINAGPNKANRLPGNTKSIVAQGVSISLEMIQQEIKNRTLMLPWVVRFLTIHAPDGPTPTYIYSPELDDGYVLHVVQ